MSFIIEKYISFLCLQLAFKAFKGSKTTIFQTLLVLPNYINISQDLLQN